MAGVNTSRARKFLDTARYLSPNQVWCRGRRVWRQKWWQTLGKTVPQPLDRTLSSFVPLYQGLEDLAATTQIPESTQAIAEAQAIASGQFTFLNETVAWDGQLDWHVTTVSHLWRYHLHYFDYVRSLLVWAVLGEERERASAVFYDLAQSWIDNNRRFHGDGWHPYTLSLRIVNWLHALGGFQSCLANSEGFRTIISSLYGQARMLRSDLEFDVRGNHLLENLRALIWAGVAFEGDEAEEWLARSLAILYEETEEQILPDGGHFERVPGYHLIVLRNYLEIGLWLQRNRGGSPHWLDAALQRMLDFLVTILPPDGQLPLLKDTAYDLTPDPQALLATAALYFDEPYYKQDEEFGLYPFLLYGIDGQAHFQHYPVNNERKVSCALPDSGYYVTRDDSAGDYLILDAGKPCPDYLPAHAHADLLSYELLVATQRIVVDSGVYQYESGDWRSFFRSTRAHNTVEVAGEDQSEVWSSFRVARRARPQVLYWNESLPWCIIQAEHDGYERLAMPVQHRRTLVSGGGFWLVVDELNGKQTTEISSFVHFHPELRPHREEEQLWRINGATVPLWLTSFGNRNTMLVQGQHEPRLQGWYSETFGQMTPNPVLVLQPPPALPLRFGYIIARNHPAYLSVTKSPAQFEVTIDCGGSTHTLTLAQNEDPLFS